MSLPLLFTTLSTAQYILIIFLGLIIYAIYITIISPYLGILFYRKQGGNMYFRPGIGLVARNRRNVREKGDACYAQKKMIHDNPNLPFYGGNIGKNVAISLAQPQLIKELASLEMKYYEKDMTRKNLLSELSKSGLITAEGEVWRKHRRIVSSVFHFEFLKEVIPLISETAHEVFDNLIKSGDLNDVNIMDVYQNITGETVGKIFFGNTLPMTAENNQPMTTILAKLVTDASRISFNFSCLILGKAFVKLGLFKEHREIMQRIEKFKAFCKETVEKRKKEFMSSKVSRKRKDLLQALLEAQAENSEEFLSTEEIVDEFVTFFVAGMDTTGHTLTMMIYYLLQNPVYFEKVKEEATWLVDEGSFSPEHLNKMAYTSAVIKETLRMGTPATGTFFRKALVDHKLGPLLIKKGTHVNAGILLCAFNERYFPNPHIFNPERWLEAITPDKIEPFVYIPFSAGPRNCIGQHLAQMEIKIIMSIFLKKFIPEIPKGYILKMNHTGVLHEPLNPVKLKLTPIF